MKVVSRNYDRDDFVYRTAVKVFASKLANTIRAINRLLGITEFNIHLALNEDCFILFYDDNRSFNAGKKIAPEISDHQKELEEIISHFV